ncbi:hypothetical protein DRP77_09485 [Candidatus Poribacteria bacterium]|nr:MAG: hypothetical protein DRP77_09485 [Candidatus Poribacteria bacterium]
MTTERTAVEEFIIQELQKLGWRYIPPKEMNILRGNDFGEPLVVDLLKSALRRINEDVELTEADLEFAIASLRRIPASPEGIGELLDKLKNGLVVPLQEEKREQVLRLLDFENPDNNEFIVTNQYEIKGPYAGRRRPDIVLIVNGIPLVLIECKSPVREETTWFDAYKQIKGYEEDVPELFKYVQFSIATDGVKTRYFPNAFKEEGEDLLSEWKDPYPFDGKDLGDDPLRIAIHGLLNRRNLLDLVENFIFMRREIWGGLSKIMARYMQFRAANKIFQRAIKRLRGGGEEKFGLIWHWQGSGKTYTMAFAAWKLHRCLEAENPSIFVVVDRKDLEEQIERDFAFIDVPLERVTSIKHLIEILTWGEKREGKRGIFLVTIEKFSPKQFQELEVKGGEVVIRRRNVIVLADEVHRTHYGKFATLMRSVFAEASIFGFTGTPLSKRERNTFQKFCPRGELYLDRYSMLDALNDGFTIPLSYEAKLPLYLLKREEIEELAKFEEEIELLSPQEKRELRRRINPIKAAVKDEQRVKEIAKSVAEHFKEVVEPTGLKAMIVAIDREACALYKRALDELLPSHYSEIVMTFNRRDKGIIKDYFEELFQRFGSSDLKAIHRKIVDDFKMKEFPKILIVTDMLITGFDAPVLWTIYLDKPLREHRILQTIARANRPYQNKKFGLIVDYIGVLKDLERAFEQFERGDVDEIRVVIRDLGEERKLFEEGLAEALSIFEGVKRDDTYESLDSALNILIDQEKAEGFKRAMKRLMRSYEMLAGEPFLKPHLRDYTWLTKVYVAYRKRFERADVDELKIEALSRKTAALIQRAIDVEGIEERYPTVTIDKRYVERLRKAPPKTVGAAIDVITNVQREIRMHQTSPFFRGLIREVEEVYEELRQRKAVTEEAIKRILGIVRRIAEWKTEREQIGERRHSIYESMKSVLPDLGRDEALSFADSLIFDLRAKGLLFEGWQEQQGVRRDVRKEIRLRVLSKFRDRGQKVDELVESVFKALEEIT